MDASEYTQRTLSDEDRANLKEKAVPILTSAGIHVPPLDKWTITDNQEERTKVMLGPAMGYQNDPEARELRGIFLDLKRGELLSRSNNPVIKCVDELHMSHLTELTSTGNKIKCYPRGEIMQIRLIYALDVNDKPKVYMLGNKFIDASNMTWSRSPTFFSMLQSIFTIDTVDDMDQLFQGDMAKFQYDIVIHNSMLTNVGQIPREWFAEKIYTPRIRIAGTNEAVVEWPEELKELFAKPTPLPVESVFDFFKYGYYYQGTDAISQERRKQIDSLMPHERPTDGVYIDIMSPDGSKFLGSVVYSTPAFEFRTKLLKTSKLDDGRICADVEKLWYMRIDGDPMRLTPDKRRKALDGWLSKPPTYSKPAVNGKPRPPKTPLFGPRDAEYVHNDDNLPPWMPGGIRELPESERVKLREQVLRLYDQGRYDDISEIYRKQAEYALRVAVSPSRRYIVSSLNSKISGNIDLVASKLAHIGGKAFNRANRDRTIQAIYRPNRKEEEDAERAVRAIFTVLEMKETITDEHIVKAATGSDAIIPNPRTYPRPTTIDEKMTVIRAILRAMGTHKFFKVLCLCRQI